MRNPIRPRAGTTYSIRIQPVPWFTTCSIRPFRSARSWLTRRRGSPRARRSPRAPSARSSPAVDRPRHDLRLADGQLEPLAAHHLDEDRELELAAALHLPRLGPLGVEHADRHVADDLLVQPRPCTSRAVTFEPSWPDSGDVLIPIVIDSDGSSTRTTGSGSRVVGVGEGLADRDLGDPRDRADLPRARLVGVDAIERLGHVELDDLHPLDRAVGPAPGDLLAATDRPVAHPAQGQPAEVRRRVEVRHERLQRHRRRRRSAPAPARAACRTAAAAVGSSASGAWPQCPSRAFAYRIGKSIWCSSASRSRNSSSTSCTTSSARASGRSTLLTTRTTGQPRLERLAQHEPRLRQRALRRVDQQQHAVDHRERPLDLAAEVGVARACRRC